MIPDSWKTVVMIRDGDSMVIEGLGCEGGVATCLQIAMERIMEGPFRTVLESARVVQGIERATESEYAKRLKDEIDSFQEAADRLVEADKRYRNRDRSEKSND